MQHRASELAELLGGRLEGDPETVITGLAKIEEAGPGELTFLANPRYEKYLDQTGAAAVLVSLQQKTPDRTVIRVDDPYLAFCRLLALYYPEENPLEPGVHPTAVLAPDVELGRNVRLGAHVCVGAGSRLGDGVSIYPNAVIGERVTIGRDSVIRAGVSLRSGVQIGSRVIIQDHAVIGSDGFGFAPKAAGDYQKIPQVGTVIIEDDVEIGAGCTIDRATLGVTRVETGTKLDNLVHVAHNVTIGAHTVIAAQTGISGSTRLGRNCMIGGQAGFVGHITLGDGSMVGAKSGISKNWPAGSKISGYLAKNHIEDLHILAAERKLPELLKKVERLEKQIEELSAKLYGK
ncbi:MAG: UDP-3-O-(3-hydroxymyristoyl)glucosamine N-acyltransferase [Candidatus Zixiibacteriota bacterium]|nr:MAG: UDP-3-O-(3-hydroxymyristoyl)glucosamine N-acyltransferase [candidate division Zixibacteria bacterium]